MFFFFPIGYGGGGLLSLIILFLIIRGIARLFFGTKTRNNNTGGYRYYYYNQSGNTSAGSTSQTYAKDPYSTLGVTRTSSDDEVKKAYRKLIRENHPDMVMDKPENERKTAEKRFREVQEAYEQICRMRGIN